LNFTLKNNNTIPKGYFVRLLFLIFIGQKLHKVSLINENGKGVHEDICSLAFISNIARLVSQDLKVALNRARPGLIWAWKILKF